MQQDHFYVLSINYQLLTKLTNSLPFILLKCLH